MAEAGLRGVGRPTIPFPGAFGIRQKSSRFAGSAATSIACGCPSAGSKLSGLSCSSQRRSCGRLAWAPLVVHRYVCTSWHGDMRCSLLASAIRPCDWLPVRPRLHRLYTRAFASSARWGVCKTVSVPLGSNGSVSLEIFPPNERSNRNGVVVYFPRGPLPFTRSVPEEPSSLQALSDATKSLTVRVNYRLDAFGNERYPLPVHDVGAAWSWMTSNLEEMQPDKKGSMGQKRIGVVGEFIGGSLAAMLAMTNCYLAPSAASIKTAYLGNPTVDWTMMSAVTPPGSREAGDVVEYAPGAKSPGRRKKAKPVSSWLEHASNPILPSTKLLGLRRTLFTNQQYPFDPFASPLLFFRTPGSPEPTVVSEDDEFFAALQGTVIEEDHSSETLMDSYVDNRQGPEGPDRSGDVSTSQNAKSSLKDADRRQCHQHQQDKGQQQGDGGVSGDGTVALATTKKPAPAFRRSYRRWPPSRSGLGLPRLHLTLGTGSPLRDMGLEIANALERSDRLYGRGIEDLESRRDDKSTRPGPTEPLASIEDREGLGVWDEAELERIGIWFRKQWDGI